MSRYFEGCYEEAEVTDEEPRVSKGNKYKSLKNISPPIREYQPPTASGSRFSLSCIQSEKERDHVPKRLPHLSASVAQSGNRNVPDHKLKRNQSFLAPCNPNGRAQNIVYQSLPRGVIFEKSKSLPSSARGSGLKISCLDSKSSDLDSPTLGEIGDDSPFARSIDIMSVPVDEVASEMTLLDLEVFQRIHPDELSSCSWTNKNKHQMAPNVVAFTRRFNFVSFWVVQEILNYTDPKLRAEMISYFIRVGKKLNELTNLHSLFALLSALKSEPIYRLKQTWRYVPKKDLLLYEKLFSLFDNADNFIKLRERMDSLSLPCIPYLGFFLTDLIHIDTAHPKSNSWSRDNRQLKINNVLRMIASYQASDFSFLRSKPKIHSYLLSVRYIEEFQKFLEDDHFKKSLSLEPPCTPQSASKESLSRSTPNTPGESPSKSHRKICGSAFVPGHRKCKSLGNNILKTTSIQRKTRTFSIDNEENGSLGANHLGQNVNQRHLIDDSIIGDNSSSTSTSLHSYCPSPDSDCLLRNLGRTRSLDSLDDDVIPPIPEGSQAVIEGCLRRKALKKNGKTSSCLWHNYWVQLRNRQVLLFPQKGLSIRWPVEKQYFREDCIKVLALSDWSVSEEPRHPDGLLMQNRKTGDVYKYRAEDPSAAYDWLIKLRLATHTSQSSISPIDLIKFE